MAKTYILVIKDRSPLPIFPRQFKDQASGARSALGRFQRSPSGVGLLYAAIAIGSIAAGLLSGWNGRVRRQGRALAIAVSTWAAAVALAGAVPPPGRRGPAGRGRSGGPRQRGLPRDDSADLRTRRHGWPAARLLHRRRRRRSPPRGPTRRRHGLRHRSRRRVDGQFTALHDRRHAARCW